MSVLLVLAGQAALAETIPIETGESLKYQCQGFQRMLARTPQEFDEFNGPRCHGYVQGITDALNGQAFCLPQLSLLDHVLSRYWIDAVEKLSGMRPVTLLKRVMG